MAALVEAWTAWQTWQMEIAADPLLPMWLSSMHGCIEWLAAHFYGTLSELSETANDGLLGAAGSLPSHTPHNCR